MCLAVPGKILEVVQRRGARFARVEFGGVTREACLNLVPEAGVGDYVLVHVGFAISRVERAEAERTYQIMQEMELLEAEGLGTAKSKAAK